jgi:hypothetical protein
MAWKVNFTDKAGVDHSEAYVMIRGIHMDRISPLINAPVAIYHNEQCRKDNKEPVCIATVNIGNPVYQELRNSGTLLQDIYLAMKDLNLIKETTNVDLTNATAV